MVTHPSSHQGAEPVQAPHWGLTPLDAKTSQTFGTPTGHKVTVLIVEGRDYSHVSVHVTNEAAYVKMGYSYFSRSNHRQECEDYVRQCISSSALEYVCTNFDALCNPFDEVAIGTSINHQN